MDIETFSRWEYMLRLRDELFVVEEDKMAGCIGDNLNELSVYLDGILDEAKHEE